MVYNSNTKTGKRKMQSALSSEYLYIYLDHTLSENLEKQKGIIHIFRTNSKLQCVYFLFYYYDQNQIFSCAVDHRPLCTTTVVVRKRFTYHVRNLETSSPINIPQ